MRDCWRIQRYEIDWDARPVALKVEYGFYAGRTTLERVLGRSFVGLSVRRHPQRGLLLLSSMEDFDLSGAIPDGVLVERLLHLLMECVSVCDDCDVSHCLDVYRIPSETAKSPEDWPYSAAGALVYKAKYRNHRTSAQQVAQEMIRFVSRHPGLAAAEAVCAVPRSSTQWTNAIDVPALCADSVAKNLGVRRIHLERVRATSPQKGIADKDERAKNQRESMRVRGEIASRAVLVLDDLYMEGDTMSEAARAARDAGATAVLGLCAVKTAKGSRGLQF